MSLPSVVVQCNFKPSCKPKLPLFDTNVKRRKLFGRVRGRSCEFQLVDKQRPERRDGPCACKVREKWAKCWVTSHLPAFRELQCAWKMQPSRICRCSAKWAQRRPEVVQEEEQHPKGPQIPYLKIPPEKMV